MKGIGHVLAEGHQHKPCPDCDAMHRQRAVEAVKGALAACEELMTEFISKRRAAKWDIINDGLIKAETFVKRHAHKPTPAER